MTALPFPPPPEFGWYDDDNTLVSDLAPFAGPSAAASQQTAEAVTTATLDGLAAQAAGQGAGGAQTAGPAGPAVNADGDIEDWDGTVLSSSFMQEAPQKRYRLHNDITGQDIVLDKSTLLGRRVSATVPEGAVSIKLDDPTRTISRSHAAISFDKDGTLWIEDYGSLNGTFIISGDHEEQVKDHPLQVSVPATLRIGDQFFNLTEA